MPRYLTVNQYKATDDGMSLSDITDRALAMVIARAESDIDSFMGFDLAQGGFEPHVTSVQRPWSEVHLRTLAPNHPVPIRQVTRYRIQVSNINTSGAGFFANINTSDCVVNRTQNYVEIVPLQAVTYSLSPVILQLGLKPPIVQMDVEVGWFLPQLGETFYSDDSGQNTTYYSQRSSWATSYTQALASQPSVLPPVPPIIYKNGVAQSSSVYTLNTVEGSTIFNSPNQPGDVISGDYTYSIPDNVRDACIMQTTYLLGQRALNKQGLQGVESVRVGYTQIKRHMNADLVQGVRGSLCSTAAQKLQQFLEVAMA